MCFRPQLGRTPSTECPHEALIRPTRACWPPEGRRAPCLSIASRVHRHRARCIVCGASSCTVRGASSGGASRDRQGTSAGRTPFDPGALGLVPRAPPASRRHSHPSARPPAARGMPGRSRAVLRWPDDAEAAARPRADLPVCGVTEVPGSYCTACERPTGPATWRPSAPVAAVGSLARHAEQTAGVALAPTQQAAGRPGPQQCGLNPPPGASPSVTREETSDA